METNSRGIPPLTTENDNLEKIAENHKESNQ